MPQIAVLSWTTSPTSCNKCRQWVCFFTQPRQTGKLTKVPINPSSGALASCNDPASWGSYGEACAYHEGHRSDRRKPTRGIGFMFSVDDTYCGIDLDDVVQDGRLSDAATEIIETLDSYAEVSLSGEGIHVIARAKLVGPGCKINGIEMYDQRRFFVVTGHILGARRPISARQGQVDDLYTRITSGRKDSKLVSIPEVGLDRHSEIRACAAPIGDGQRVIDHLRRNSKSKALFNGTTAPYQSASEADLALCGWLAFFCGANLELIDTVFRCSGLFRPKWDSVHGSETYGRRTIRKAIAGQIKTWQPFYNPTTYDFPSELLEASRVIGPVGALMLQFVYWKTILFGKDNDWIADAQIAEALRMKPIQVGRRRRVLQKANLLLVTRSQRRKGETRQYRSVNLEALKRLLGSESSSCSATICVLPSALLHVAQIIGPAQTLVLQAAWRTPRGFCRKDGKIRHEQIGRSIGLGEKAARKHCLALIQPLQLMSRSVRVDGPPELRVDLAAVENLVREYRTRIRKGCAPTFNDASAHGEGLAEGSCVPCEYDAENVVAAKNPTEEVGQTDFNTLTIDDASDPQPRRIPPAVAAFASTRPTPAELSGKTIVDFLGEHGVHVDEKVAHRWFSELLPTNWSPVTLARFLYERRVLKCAARKPEDRATRVIEKVLRDIKEAGSSKRRRKRQAALKDSKQTREAKVTSTKEYFAEFFGIDSQYYQQRYDDLISSDIRRMTAQEAKAA